MKLVAEITRALNHVNTQIKLTDVEHKNDEDEIKLLLIVFLIVSRKLYNLRSLVVPRIS